MKRVKGDLYSAMFSRRNAEIAFSQVIGTLSKHIPSDHTMRYVRKRDAIISRILDLREGAYTLRRTTRSRLDKSTGKIRDITSEAFVDQVIDQMAVNVIKPSIERSMDYHSYAISKGRGPMEGSRRIRKWMIAHKGSCRYCVKADVSKCFPTMPHRTVFRAIDRKWKDKRLRRFLKLRVSTMGNGRGLVIGNRISQWMCELAFQGLDRFARQTAKAKGYSRNQDDFGLLAKAKARAWNLMWRLCHYVEREMGMSCKAWQVHQTALNGYDFLGYRHYVGKAVLRKRGWLRFRRSAIRVRRNPCVHACRSFMSRLGWVMRSDCSKALGKYVRRARMSDLRSAISEADRERNLPKPQ